MHAKTDSEATSIDASWLPRSPRRPVYYVQSPSNHDVEKMSYGSSPTASPPHHYYHCSPIHHSRESSTSRFSASLKNPRNLSAWRHVQIGHGDDDDDDDDEMDGRDGGKPNNHIVFENFHYQAGNDQSGVPTDMLSVNSTVKISYRNPATFYAVHVTSTPWELHHFQLKIASGQMKKFTESRKSQRKVVTIVQGYQVPLYGGIPVLVNARDDLGSIAVPLNLTFVMRSKAYILGRLVKTKFYGRIRCSVTLRGNKLGKPLNLTDSCVYQ
ncbi:Late embryogenesis abundant protein, LEA-14 [Corchorus olitorius]|uniref:Late embryogenesis abundant protein, LEA-14 n=1 Tax=Corchorus olitorius TaxID=93759 RepID=A0A1R3JAY9_9ROSI|nr:Late embryogenesis abundant protein, LEA-14 [Corchorus olitorius]